jgi:hypothetical protein
MPLPEGLGEAKPLGDFLERLHTLPPWTWLYIAADARTVTLALPCHPRTTNSGDMSDEENDEFDASVGRAGLKCFLSPEQLEDIIENLRQQRPAYSPTDMVAAIDFYCRNDAFMEFDREPA